MKCFNLGDFIGGWVVGDFEPSILKSKDVEVAIKRYRAGDFEKSHYHKLADEITIIVSGRATMNGTPYVKDNIILIEKGENVDFVAETDVVTCVIKLPSVIGDKYSV